MRIRVQPSVMTVSLLFTCVVFSAVISRAAEKPNIVFILADDVGREVLGCYGGESYRTPNLDQLAASGAKFTHCYAMPVCHPTRVTLLTGRYPRHLGNPKWGSFPRAEESKTFAHAVRDAGYATAIAGKWQICMMQDDPDHPARLGFDEWSLFGWHEGPRYHEPMIYQNGKLRNDTTGKYGPDLYVDFLVDFIERNRSKPFMAYFSMALCHDVTDDLKAPVPYGKHGRYDSFSEMANTMDVEVGRLIQALDRLRLREKTLIVFTADNGTAMSSIIRAQNNRYIREPVFSMMNGTRIPGGKTKLTDWGTRVPMIAAWKGVIEPGQTWDDLVDFSDILPTFVELCGGRLPVGVRMDGQSFAARLSGRGTGSRDWVCAEGRGKFFVKTRDWKLYSDGRIFHTQIDSFENRPVAANAVPEPAREDLKVLREAMAVLRQRGR